MAKQKVTAKVASRSVGYGYSSIVNDLMTALDRAITNSDEFRTYYKQMLSDDETIGTGLEYLTGRVVSRIGTYSHENADIKELVDRSIESIKGTLKEVRQMILRISFVYDYGTLEFTFQNDSDEWVLTMTEIY